MTSSRRKRLDPSEVLSSIDPRLLRSLSILGFGEVLAARIVAHYDSNEIEVARVLNENIYDLMDIEGIGFARADAAAKILNISDQDPRRQSALVQKVMADNSSFGHVFLPITLLEKEMRKAKIDNMDYIQELAQQRKIVIDDNRVYLKRMWEAELEVLFLVEKRLEPELNDECLAVPILSKIDIDSLSRVLDTEQFEAIQRFAFNNIFVLTGGPGCGKTHTINQVCKVLEDAGKHIKLCAPTGKAAKRMTDLSGRPATTIHRMLKASWGSWEFNRRNKLVGLDYIIIDESSMLTLDLFWRIITAIPNTTRIILVGDVDQLPPVGPGSPFKDLIDSGRVKTVRLRTNHRQGRGSMIAETALAINRGSMQISFNDDDLVFVEVDDPITLRSKILPLVEELAREYDYLREMQILTPQKMGLVGTESLNELLRTKLNPDAIRRRCLLPTVGDKVMQTSNDYDLGIFNGFVGQILSEDSKEFEIEFFDHETIDYPKSRMKALMLAYACTIHKAQGSEFKSGILVVSSSHQYMLSRNLIYTGITRFRERCIVLGDKNGLRRAIRNKKENDRYGRLCERLRGELITVDPNRLIV